MGNIILRASFHCSGNMASRSILRPVAVGKGFMRCISATRRYASQQTYEYLLVSNPKPGVALCIWLPSPSCFCFETRELIDE